MHSFFPAVIVERFDSGATAAFGEKCQLVKNMKLDTFLHSAGVKAYIVVQFCIRNVHLMQGSHDQATRWRCSSYDADQCISATRAATGLRHWKGECRNGPGLNGRKALGFAKGLETKIISRFQGIDHRLGI